MLRKRTSHLFGQYWYQCSFKVPNLCRFEKLNESSFPIFVIRVRQKVFDIILCSRAVVQRIAKCHVSAEVFLSDHHHIYFELISSCALPVDTYRKPKLTDWETYKMALTKAPRFGNRVMRTKSQPVCGQYKMAQRKCKNCLLSRKELSRQLRKNQDTRVDALRLRNDNVTVTER